MNKICTSNMKSYTSVEQSRKLAEFLPLESADMILAPNKKPYFKESMSTRFVGQIPCWSASALLEIIRNNGRYELQMYEGGYYFEANGFITESYFNAVDACYEMILKLYELKLL